MRIAKDKKFVDERGGISVVIGSCPEGRACTVGSFGCARCAKFISSDSIAVECAAAAKKIFGTGDRVWLVCDEYFGAHGTVRGLGIESGSYAVGVEGKVISVPSMWIQRVKWADV